MNTKWMCILVLVAFAASTLCATSSARKLLQVPRENGDVAQDEGSVDANEFSDVAQDGIPGAHRRRNQ